MRLRTILAQEGLFPSNKTARGGGSLDFSTSESQGTYDPDKEQYVTIHQGSDSLSATQEEWDRVLSKASEELRDAARNW